MGRRDIVGRNPTSRGSGFQSCRSDRRQSHHWHQALWGALRHLPRHGEGRSIGLAGRKGPISAASTTGGRGCGRRSRNFLLLEDQAWHPVERNAVMEADAHRPADLEPCSVPQAYGQTSARRRTGMTKCRELRLTVMKISIHSLLEGATRATGTVAVIDVFRAFTSAAVALANGGIEDRYGPHGRRGTGASASR